MSTALAPTTKNDIRTLVASDRAKEQMALVLPKHMTPDRMSRVVLTAINKNPKLLECTPESLMLALMQCSQYGVEPDGRYAHLIPYFDKKENCLKAQFQWDYKGLVAQIRKSPDVRDVYADVICSNDTYAIKSGLHRDLFHEIDITRPRGEFIAAYAVIAYKDGSASFDVLTKEDVEKARKSSKSGDYGPWKDWYEEMAKKTAIKRLSKLAPLTSEQAEIINADTDFDGEPASRVQIERPVIGRVAAPETARIEAPAEKASEPVTETKAPEKPVEKPAAKVEKPKPGTLKKTPPVEQKKEDAPEIVKYSATAQKVSAKLEEDKVEVPEFITLMIDNEWCEKNATSLTDVPDDNLESALSNWDQVLEEINKKRVGVAE